MKNSIINKIENLKVLPVIAIENASDAVNLGKTLVDNFLPAAEITYRTCAATKTIESLKDNFPEMLVCAGTAITKQNVLDATQAGADFVITPGFNPKLVDFCLSQDIDIIPGINNPSQIEIALDFSLEYLKFFPAEASGGIKMLNSLLGPYKDIKIMPTGGITPSNLKDYLSIKRVIGCGGTWIAPSKSISENDWDSIKGNIIELQHILKNI